MRRLRLKISSSPNGTLAEHNRQIEEALGDSLHSGANYSGTFPRSTYPPAMMLSEPKTQLFRPEGKQIFGAFIAWKGPGHTMWKCKNCEHVVEEDDFTTCWRCGERKTPNLGPNPLIVLVAYGVILLPAGHGIIVPIGLLVLTAIPGFLGWLGFLFGLGSLIAQRDVQRAVLGLLAMGFLLGSAAIWFTSSELASLTGFTAIPFLALVITVIVRTSRYLVARRTKVAKV